MQRLSDLPNIWMIITAALQYQAGVSGFHIPCDGKLTGSEGSDSWRPGLQNAFPLYGGIDQCSPLLVGCPNSINEDIVPRHGLPFTPPWLPDYAK